jgi:hypothetical protein
MEPLWKAIVRLRPAVESSPKRAAHFCFGSKVDIEQQRPSDVRFTPESGHLSPRLECPLSANSGRTALRQKKELFDNLISGGE